MIHALFSYRASAVSNAISFEFFPPKTDEQRAILDATVNKLKPLRPEYVSCTFGAGGSTLDYTVETIGRLRDQHQLVAAPHLSCMGGKRSEISALLQTYKNSGIDRLVALRGDMPSGMASYGELHYARDLVEFIRQETGNHFHIEVGCYPEIHPQAENASADVDRFCEKVRVGANGAITQYFFNADAYFWFLEEVRGRGIDVPITPGIMPISNYSQLKRFSDMCGAEIPRWLSKRLSGFADDVDSIREYGADVVATMCEQLLDGDAPGLHFYTLNRAKATLAVCERLGLPTDN
jgi:methylenetetrahydrofolate reductase (NADPH)